MGFVANFIRFPAVQKIENQLRFDKVTESLKVGTFLRQCTGHGCPPTCCPTNSISVVKLIATMLVQHKKVIVG